MKNLLSSFRLPADLSPQVKSNTVHYYFDIGWWGLYAGATAAFLTIYAARIGATPAQIGMLSALPAGIALALSLPFAGLVRRLGAHSATWLGAAIARVMLGLFALLPFVFPSPEQNSLQVWAILAISSLMALPNTLTGIGFPQLLIEALPANWRGYVVGARNAFFSIITFAITLLSGQILERMAFPAGYQVVFLIGCIGAVMTAYHLSRVRPVTQSVETPPAPGPGLLARGGRLFPPIDESGRRYLRVLALLFLFNTTNHMLAPLAPDVLVNQLQLSDAWISIGTAAGSLIIFIISIGIARLTGRTGNRRATAIGASLMAAQALLLALARDPLQYMLYVVVGGVGQGILLSAQYNYHIENVPETDRAHWLSWALLTGNAALLLGSLGGPLLAAWVGIPVALALFGLLRLGMAGVLLRWG